MLLGWPVVRFLYTATYVIQSMDMFGESYHQSTQSLVVQAPCAMYIVQGITEHYPRRDSRFDSGRHKVMSQVRCVGTYFLCILLAKHPPARKVFRHV